MGNGASQAVIIVADTDRVLVVFLIVFIVVPFLLIAVFCFKFLILSLLVEVIVVSILDAKVLPFPQCCFIMFCLFLVFAAYHQLME